MMALAFGVFSLAAMAAAGTSAKKNLSLPTLKQSEKIEIAKAKISEVFNNYEIKELAVEQGYILIKIHFIADCPGYYSTVMVLTIKIWDDGCVELYPWFQDQSLVCS